VSQIKKELRVFTFDDLSKKPLKCVHYYCTSSNKPFVILSEQTVSNWRFDKVNGSHLPENIKNFTHLKLVEKGYLPEVYEIAKMTKANDTARIYLQKMHENFNYNFKNIIFKEDLSVDQEASKYFLSLHKDYLLAKDLRLKIVIVNVYSPFATTEESKTKAAYNLKKLLGFEERISIKIDNSLPEGNNNEVVFKVLVL
jgi:hypothetical protein